MEVKNLTWPVVDEVFDGGELLMCELAEVHTFGREFAHQAVGVFVGAALPRAVGVAELDVDLDVRAQCLTQRHLRTLIVGHGFAEALRNAFEPTLEAVELVLCSVAVEFDQHDVAADALDQRAHGRAVHGALDEVALPVAGHDARGHLGRAQADVGHVGQAALAGSTPGARQPGLVALAQQAHQLDAQRVARHGVDAAVDRLARDRHQVCRHRLSRLDRCLVHARKFARDLLGRLAAAQAVHYRTPQRRTQVRTQLVARRTTSAALLDRSVLSDIGLVVGRRRRSR